MTTEPISTREQLCEHLRTAVVLELSTIPVYLTALWSIPDESNREVQQLIRSVVMEEMLHMCLAANVLHAVRGHDHEGPRITGEHAPTYPGVLHHSAGLELTLQPFGREALELFCTIEHPAPPSAPPEPGAYHTIGQFYAAILDGLDRLGDELFRDGHHPECQVPPDRAYYGSGGQAVLVHDLATAVAALREVVEQGEGHGSSPWEHFGEPGDRTQLAHFYRFDELRKGRQYRLGDEAGRPSGAIIVADLDVVRPIAVDIGARRDDELPAGVARLLDECDVTYRRLLAELESALNGEPDRLLTAVPVMYQLGYQSRSLMNIPLGDGRVAAPRFRA